MRAGNGSITRSLLPLLLAAAMIPSSGLLAQTKKGSCCAPASKSASGKGAASKSATKGKVTKSCCAPSASAAKAGDIADASAGQVSVSTLPDVTLVNQNGERVRLHDLIRGRVVAMNFIFTTCTTICPPMGANFSRLVDLMEDYVGKDVAMISVSIDPVTDTPERLRAWSQKFGASAGWTLLTGAKDDVDALLKALKVYTPAKENHTPTMMIGGADGTWIRANALAAPETLANAIKGKLPKERVRIVETVANLARERRPLPRVAVTHGLTNDPQSMVATSAPATAAPAAPSVAARGVTGNDDADRQYFSDVKLKNQFGEEMRFYSDLLRDKVVVIDVFFARCTGSCPVMSTTMSRLQEHLGDHVGKDVNLISITVDPEHDTPETLGDYADRFGARRGWYFLSGAPEEVHQVLKRIGNDVGRPDEHKTIMLVGNVPTRLWKKVDGLSPADEIIPVVDAILKDRK